MTLATAEIIEPVIESAPDEDVDTGPVRRCVATGVSAAPDGMVRFVVGPDQTVFPDLAESLPGRGLWVMADADALAAAIKKNAFAKAARSSVVVPDGLAVMVHDGLLRRCLDFVSLARRAGAVVSGYERVVEALRDQSDRWSVVVESTDATENARRKMRGPAGDLPVIRFADGSALGAVLGRERCVHAVVAHGGLADRLVRDAARLNGLKPAPDADGEVSGKR